MPLLTMGEEKMLDELVVGNRTIGQFAAVVGCTEDEAGHSVTHLRHLGLVAKQTTVMLTEHATAHAPRRGR